NFGTTTSGNPLNPMTGFVTNSAVTGTMRQILPPAKIGRGGFVIVMELVGAGTSAYGIRAITSLNSSNGNITATTAITPIEMQEIDQKMDDGHANTGNIWVPWPVTACNLGTGYD